MSSIQTWKWEKLQADLASLWATLFPSLRVWLKDKLLKAAAKDLIPLMMCPKLEDSHPPLDNALMVISESPSKIIWSRLSSCAKPMALCVANTSTVSTDVGNGIICVKAAITRPLSFRMMQPRPARLFSLKIAPSKFIFIQPLRGGSHLSLVGIFEASGRTAAALWNSNKLSKAKALTIHKGGGLSPTLTWFLQVQISETVMANNSKRSLRDWQSWMTSTN